MQSLLIYSAITASIVGLALTGTIPCGRNEEFTQCGSFCPHTCQNHTSHIEKCAEICVIGCFCRAGYVRKSIDGPCVPVEECRDVSQCEENEEFGLCHSACPSNCNDPDPKFCPAKCVKGCACKEGYIRESEGGKCVPEETCIKEDACEENEIFKECGSVCPSTCSEPVRSCQKSCSRGCFCKDGYVLDDETKKCVRIEDCPGALL